MGQGDVCGGLHQALYLAQRQEARGAAATEREQGACGKQELQGPFGVTQGLHGVISGSIAPPAWPRQLGCAVQHGWTAPPASLRCLLFFDWDSKLPNFQKKVAADAAWYGVYCSGHAIVAAGGRDGCGEPSLPLTTSYFNSRSGTVTQNMPFFVCSVARNPHLASLTPCGPKKHLKSRLYCC